MGTGTSKRRKNDHIHHEIEKLREIEREAQVKCSLLAQERDAALAEASKANESIKGLEEELQRVKGREKAARNASKFGWRSSDRSIMRIQWVHYYSLSGFF